MLIVLKNKLFTPKKGVGQKMPVGKCPTKKCPTKDARQQMSDKIGVFNGTFFKMADCKI